MDDENPINVTDPIGVYDYQYDGNGNRTALSVDTVLVDYNYDADSNRLAGYVTTTAEGLTVDKDAAGNTVRLFTTGDAPADVAVPEPTDATWPKWVGWGFDFAGAMNYESSSVN